MFKKKKNTITKSTNTNQLNPDVLNIKIKIPWYVKLWKIIKAIFNSVYTIFILIPFYCFLGILCFGAGIAVLYVASFIFAWGILIWIGRAAYAGNAAVGFFPMYIWFYIGTILNMFAPDPFPALTQKLHFFYHLNDLIVDSRTVSIIMNAPMHMQGYGILLHILIPLMYMFFLAITLTVTLFFDCFLNGSYGFIGFVVTLIWGFITIKECDFENIVDAVDPFMLFRISVYAFSNASGLIIPGYNILFMKREHAWFFDPERKKEERREKKEERRARRAQRKYENSIFAYIPFEDAAQAKRDYESGKYAQYTDKEYYGPVYESDEEPAATAANTSSHKDSNNSDDDPVYEDKYDAGYDDYGEGYEER